MQVTLAEPHKSHTNLDQVPAEYRPMPCGGYKTIASVPGETQRAMPATPHRTDLMQQALAWCNATAHKKYTPMHCRTHTAPSKNITPRTRLVHEKICPVQCHMHRPVHRCKRHRAMSEQHTGLLLCIRHWSSTQQRHAGVSPCVQGTQDHASSVAHRAGLQLNSLVALD